MIFMRIAAVPVALALAAPAPSQPERGADLLPVTFAVVSGNGQAVVDLRPEDVAIRIDGRDRPIKSLQLIDVRGTPRATLAPPFGTNGVDESGRLFVLALDEDSFKPGGEEALRDAVDAFLPRLAAADRITLVTLPYGGVKVPPTTEHVRVRTALATTAGRGAATETGSDFACRTRLTLEALARQLDALGPRESPEIVLLVTAGLAAPRRDAPVTLAPGMCELSLESYREVGAAAGRARAQLYVIPPKEILQTGTVQRENIAGTGFQGSDNPVEGIEQLLGVTGGRLFNIGGSGTGAFDRVLAESAAYYVATIDAQRNDRGGRGHQLDVRVSVRGTEVRAPRTIGFPAFATSGPKPGAPSPREMISSRAVFRDLPLRAAAFTSGEEPDGRIRVIVLAEPADGAAKLSSVIAAVFDRDGKPGGSWVAQPQDLERAPVVGAMFAPAGNYRLRVAAIDASGRSGTADYDVTLGVARSGSLKVSGLLLGLARAGAFMPRLQFASEPVAIGYLEMSGAPAGAAVSATLELADEPNGPARVTVPLTITSTEPERYVAKGALPIGALPPGDYVVRAIVGLEGHPPTRVERTLRKVAPGK